MKRDRDRNTKDLKVLYKRCWKLEIELAEEKDKSRTLGVQLARSEEQVI